MFKFLKITIISIVCLCSNALSTENVYTEFYVQTTGSNLNSGSTTSNSSEFTYASGNWVASTGVFTVASGNPSTDFDLSTDKFASVYADGSTTTGFIGRITARTSTTITVSLSAIHGSAPTDGTGTRTLKVGGAWAGPSGSSGFPLNFAAATAVNAAADPVRINFKNGTYFVTTAITRSIAGPVFFEGYQTTPGDKGTSPIIDGGAAGTEYTVLSISSSQNSFDNFTFQHHGNADSGPDTSTRIVSVLATSNIIKRCTFKNAWEGGLYNFLEAIFYECEVTNCRLRGIDANSSGGINLNKTGSLGLRLLAYDNILDGFSTDGGITLVKSISANNLDDGSGSTGDENLFCFSNDFFANGSHGYSLGDGSNDQMNCLFINNNFVDNGGYGLKVNTQPTPGPFFHNAFGSGNKANTSGSLQIDRWFLEIGSVNYTNDITPYSDFSVDDFRITHSEAVEAGYGTFTQIAPGYTGPTTAHISIGAAQ